MDDQRALKHLKNYKPSIDDLKNKSPENIKWSGKVWPEGRENIPSIEQRIEKILNDDSFSVHSSRLEEYQLRNAVRYLAKRLQLLEQIVKAYKTGNL